MAQSCHSGLQTGIEHHTFRYGLAVRHQELVCLAAPKKFDVPSYAVHVFWCPQVIPVHVASCSTCGRGRCRMGKNTLPTSDARAAVDGLWGSELPSALPQQRDAATRGIKRLVAELFFKQQPKTISEPVKLQAAAEHVAKVLGQDWEQAAGFTLLDLLKDDACFALSHTSATAPPGKATIRLKGHILKKVSIC